MDLNDLEACFLGKYYYEPSEDPFYLPEGFNEEECFNDYDIQDIISITRSNNTYRVLIQGEDYEEDYVEDRINIELDHENCCSRIWFG